MMLFNPQNLSPLLNAMRQELKGDLAELANQVATTSATLSQTVVNGTNSVIADIADLTTVNGQISTEVQAINQHTTNAMNGVKTHTINALKNTNSVITGAKTAIIQASNESVNNARVNTNSVITAAKTAIISNTDSEVAAAKNAINSNVNNKVTQHSAIKAIHRVSRQGNGTITIPNVNMSKTTVNLLSTSYASQGGDYGIATGTLSAVLNNTNTLTISGAELQVYSNRKYRNAALTVHVEVIEYA